MEVPPLERGREWGEGGIKMSAHRTGRLGGDHADSAIGNLPVGSVVFPLVAPQQEPRGERTAQDHHGTEYDAEQIPRLPAAGRRRRPR